MLKKCVEADDLNNCLCHPIRIAESTWYIPLQARDHGHSKRCLAPKTSACFIHESWIMSKKTPGNNWKSDNFTQTGVFLFSFFFWLFDLFSPHFLVVWPTTNRTPNLWMFVRRGNSRKRWDKRRSRYRCSQRAWSSSTFPRSQYLSIQCRYIYIYTVYLLSYTLATYIHILYTYVYFCRCIQYT